MDSGNRLVAGSSDSAAQLDSVVATVHSPVPRAHAAFPEFIWNIVVALRPWYRACSDAGTAGCFGVGRGARGLGRPSRSLAWRGSAVAGTGNAAGASLSSREVENGTLVRSGRRERPRADHADSIIPFAVARSIQSGTRARKSAEYRRQLSGRSLAPRSQQRSFAEYRHSSTAPRVSRQRRDGAARGLPVRTSTAPRVSRQRRHAGARGLPVRTSTAPRVSRQRRHGAARDLPVRMRSGGSMCEAVCGVTPWRRDRQSPACRLTGSIALPG